MPPRASSPPPPGRTPIRRYTSLADHADCWHNPDDDESHAPPTRSHSPLHADENDQRPSSGTDEHTVTGENSVSGEAGDAEKGMRRRAPADGVPQEKEQNVPPEERHWQDDIVT
jgi:hypothetical protein